MLQCLGSPGPGNVALDARNEVFKNVLLEGTQLRRPLYSGRRNRSTLRNTLFLLKKSDMQPKDVVGAPGESDVSNNCPGQAAKGPISEKTQNIHQWSLPLAKNILKICVSNTRSLFFLTPLGPRVCSRRAHKPNGGLSPGGTGR